MQRTSAAANAAALVHITGSIQLLHIVGPLFKDPPVCVLIPVAHEPQIHHKLFLPARRGLIPFPFISLSAVFLAVSHVFPPDKIF